MFTLRLKFVLPVLILFCLQVSAQNKDQFLEGFRGLKWGATLNEVELKESASYLQTFNGWGINALSYNGNFAGLPARIDYSFKNNHLIEGTYTFKPSPDFFAFFNDLKNNLTGNYGDPDYRVGPEPAAQTLWIKENNYGLFRGPEFYWEFENGFIGLHSSRYKDEVTIVVLYVYKTKIEDYVEERLIPLK